MPRRVEDIIPSGRRSIREIPVESVKPLREENIAARDETEQPSTARKAGGREVPLKRLPIAPPLLHEKKLGRNSKGKKVTLAVFGVLIVFAGIAYTASTLFSRALFTIMPREVPVAVNGTFVVSSTPKAGSLVYEILTASAEASTTVPAIEGALIEQKARGTVTLYNAHRPTAWRLVAGTRLTDDGGTSVYRLTGSVSIPGYTKSSNGTIIPGKLNTTVVADQAGQEYDIPFGKTTTDFTVIAYKGTDKYETVYAKLAKNITGGFVGRKKTIEPAVLASTTANLKAQLTARLRSEVEKLIPRGKMIYDDAYLTYFGDTTIGGDETNKAVVSVKGTMNGIVFDRAELVKKLAGVMAVDTFGEYAYDAPGLELLDFSISNPKDFSPEKKNALVIQLKGDMKLAGAVPVNELKAKFAGLSLSETEEILRAYAPALDLEQSFGQVVPPWSKVPKDPGRIEIFVK